MKRWYWVVSPKTEYVFSQRRHYEAIKARQNRILYFYRDSTVFPKENEARSNGWCLKYNSLLDRKRCTRQEFCVIRKIFLIFLIEDYIITKAG